jgi:SAM-dependent methyltransferase
MDPDRTSQLDALAEIYICREPGQASLFEIWESGGARGDSVTPSTYSAEYREWMTDKIIQTLDEADGMELLSLGCGNAAVEAKMVRKGYRVLGVDVLQEAVDLAQAKGVPTVRADITTWTPTALWPVIYMDGVLGHLYNVEDGLRPTLSRVRSWLGKAVAEDDRRVQATLIASNDTSRDGRPAQPAPGLNGFHWLSGEYLQEQALAVGFDDVSVEPFVYDRPQSGPRTRAVLMAHVRKQAG